LEESKELGDDVVGLRGLISLCRLSHFYARRDSPIHRNGKISEPLQEMELNGPLILSY
jgi:hypothetical protein